MAVGGLPPGVGPIGESASSQEPHPTQDVSTPNELLPVTGTPPSISGVRKEANEAAATNQAQGLREGFNRAFPK